MSQRAGPSVLLIGLDAACLEVLDPLMESDAVPTLSGILESGTSGPLESQIPPWTPSAWPSLYTGVNPGKHGVFGFLTFDGYDWSVVNHTHVRELSLWELLDHHGLSSVVVNVPVTHPPRSVDGAIVPGYTAPEEPECHPEGLLEDVRAEIGEYRVYGPDADGRDEQIEGYRRLTRMRGDAFRYLCDRFDPDFGFVEFQQTDTVFHERPEDEDAIRAVYQAVDDEVDRMLDRYDPDLVVLASDHGMGPYDGHEFRVNDYLHEHGFVEVTRDGGAMPSWSRLAETQLTEGEAGDQPVETSDSVLARLSAAAARVGITSQRLDRLLSALGVRDLALRVAPQGMVEAAAEQVDFRASKAYMRDRVKCGVRLNLAGREPDGTVAESEYEAVRDDLIELLRDVRDPDGQPVFERVLRCEYVFDGPYVEEAPDVIVVPNQFDQFLSSSIRGQTFGPPSEPYNHKFEGLLALSGPAIDDVDEWPNPDLFDVAPTICSALGVPWSDRMDGSPLPMVESSEKRSYPRYTTGSDDGQSAGDAVESRLADLGYLE